MNELVAACLPFMCIKKKVFAEFESSGLDQ